MISKFSKLGMTVISGLERDEAESAHILLIVMFLLETDDTLALFEHDVVPVTNATICLHFSNRVVVLVAESDFVHPVFASFDSNFAYRSIRRQIDT